MNAAHALCPCGSGLRVARCCGLDLSTLSGADATRALVPSVERAAQANAQGAVDEADRLCREVLELAPGQIDALTLLYQICRTKGRQNAADAILHRIVRIEPNNFWATNELTIVLMNRGDLAEAQTHARNAVRIAPENPQAHNLMGMVMTESNRPQIGEYHYRKVLELSQRRDPIVLANLAWNLKNQGKIAESRRTYEESLSLDPNILQTVLGWARMEEVDRNFDRAEELLNRADALSPNNSSVMLSRAVLFGRKRAYTQALDVLDAIAAQQQGGVLGSEELLEKGRLLDRMGRYEEAFDAFAQGKHIHRERSGVSYLADQARHTVEGLKGFFNQNRLRILPRASVANESPQPIFIIGFPRSGTTLVEQTLTAHPRISAGDELPFIDEITNIMPRMLNSPLAYPEALAELWMGDRRDGLDDLRNYYLQRVKQLGIIDPGAAWFTDKMPLNETHLGLIALLFPRSPIIHVLRHPLDVVLSTFSNHLTHGFYCSYELETAARHYALILELIEHYRAEMTLRYLPIRYEDIVDDQEDSVRRMLDFIGEPFDERCLSFQENRRYARTASYAQVTEKLYDRSRFRYRRYLKQMEPIIPILEPAIHRLGYPVD